MSNILELVLISPISNILDLDLSILKKVFRLRVFIGKELFLINKEFVITRLSRKFDVISC